MAFDVEQAVRERYEAAAVIYKGSLKKVFDDDGLALERGARMAVCDKTFQIYTKAPYKEDITAVEPLESVPLDEAREFDCRRTAKRNARETKGLDYDLTDLSGAANSCAPGENCC